jgi:hypothetical protein
MLLSTFFDHVNAAYRGTDDDAPTTGTPDYTEWLLVANRKKDEFAKDPNNKWGSLFQPSTSVGTVVAGTQSYNLPTTFFVPSDRVRVVLNGNTTHFNVVKPQERSLGSNAVYVSGSNPQTLTFYDTITSSSTFVGGTIYVPGYFVPADLTTATDIIPVNDPYWLVYAVAAELAFNDLTYEDKYAELVAKANDRYQKMAQANRQGTSDNPRVARYSVVKIPGSNT